MICVNLCGSHQINVFQVAAEADVNVTELAINVNIVNDSTKKYTYSGAGGGAEREK